MSKFLTVAVITVFVGLSACAHSLVGELDGIESSVMGVALMDTEKKATAEIEKAREHVCDARQAYSRGNLTEAKRLTALAKEQADAAQMKQFE